MSTKAEQCEYLLLSRSGGFYCVCSRARGAVLGDEAAVAAAGCNTSSRRRGWPEGSDLRRMEKEKCPFLRVAACPLCVSGQRFPHGRRAVRLLIFFDWRDWMRRVRNARWCCRIKVDLGDSLADDMVA